MGKASRGKKGVKVAKVKTSSNGNIGGGMAADVSADGINAIGTKLFSSVCLESAIQAVDDNDPDALEAWADQFERFSGQSFLDQKFDCVENDGSMVKHQMIIAATRLSAAECVACLLRRARSKRHSSYLEWMHTVLPMFESMPGEHPQMPNIARILKAYFQPVTKEDAISLLEQTADCRPSLAALIQSVAGGYLADLEREDLGDVVVSGSRLDRSTKMRI